MIKCMAVCLSCNTTFFSKQLISVSSAWTEWNDWSEWSYICNSASRYRDRQCPGSVPKGQINKPEPTPQFGGERDCDGDFRETQSRSSPICNRKSYSST